MTTQPLLKRLIRTLAVCAISLAGAGTTLTTHAEPYVIHKDGAMVLDKATGLVWMRCSLGQNWNGTTCAGEAKRFTYAQAQQAAENLNAESGFGGHKDWTVPSIRQLASLIFCSSNRLLYKGDLKDGGALLAHRCGEQYIRPTVHWLAFPNFTGDSRWSSSREVNVRNGAWHVDWSDGFVLSNSVESDIKVILVRSSQLLGSEIALDFKKELPTAMQVLTQNAAMRQAEADRIKEQEDKKKRNDTAAAERMLAAKSAQGLYLDAGKAQRSGSVSINNIEYSASELYERIIEKFPKSEYAVKASDQLNAMGRTNQQAGAARDRQNGNRQACEAQKRTCEVSCGDASYWNGRTYVENQSWSNCKSRCNSISCN